LRVYTKEIGGGGRNERGGGIWNRKRGGKWSGERSVFRGEDQDERLRLIAVH
jgi:hypothetical protein